MSIIKEKQHEIFYNDVSVGTIHSVGPLQAVRSTFINLGTEKVYGNVKVESKDQTTIFTEVTIDSDLNVHYDSVTRC